MARRGKCRCGTVLTFAKTSLGYKTRCPGCQAVVRLRLDEPARSGKSAAVPPPPPPVPPPPLPAAETQAAGTTLPEPDPPDFSFLGQHEPSGPVALAKMEVYRGPERAPSRGPLVVFAVIAVLVVLGVGTAALLWG